MGNKNSAPPIVKDGELYSRVRGNLRPFDLVLFSGNDFVSDTIKYLEYKQLRKPEADDFSHVGMIVTDQILNHPLVQPGKVYIWESTMSGKLADGVPNIDGRSFLGVQLRDFDEVIKAYDVPNDTRIAYASLKQNPLDSPADVDIIKSGFTELFNSLNGTLYDLNCLSLLGALYPCIRPCRNCCMCRCNSDWLFCSELVATVYKRFGIFPQRVRPENVVPVDFLPGVDHDGTPCVINPPQYITTLRHFRG